MNRADAAMASVIHDTDFDERVRMLRKNVHERLSGGHHQGLGIPTDDLSRAIDGLYSAFAWRRLSDPFKYCDCCITAATAGRLRGPLRLLDADDLYTISANFPHTAGKREDLLYFTPRILEHAASESCYLDLSQIFSKFQERPALSAHEVAAVDRFFRLVWTALTEVDPYHPLGVVNVVLPTAVLTGEIGTYLDLWRESPAVYRYAASWDDEGTLGNVFWDRGSEAHRSVVDWFRTNREMLLDNFDRYSAALAAQSAERVETAKHRLATLS